MIIQLTQGTDEWKTWRSTGLGGSDSSKLMGSSYLPKSNVTTLWKDKNGLEPPFEMNDAVAHGMQFEEEARQFYTDITKNEVDPLCMQSDELDFMKASMDGITADLKIAVEIKIPQERNWIAATKGAVKDYYYSQMQHQLFVSGAEYCDYWVYNREEGACHFTVPACEEYIEELVRRSTKFWEEFILKGICPTSADFGIDDKKTYDPFTCEGMDTVFNGMWVLPKRNDN